MSLFTEELAMWTHASPQSAGNSQRARRGKMEVRVSNLISAGKSLPPATVSSLEASRSV